MSKPVAPGKTMPTPELVGLGLQYVSDESPGITRRRVGKGFSYRDAAGRTLHDKDTLAWIRSLAIPPAWRQVWICPQRNGHLLATGRDARGRKQYRYHPRWRSLRDDAKFDRMLAFARGPAPHPRRGGGGAAQAPAWGGARCWRRSCVCWRRRSSGSATTSMPAPTAPSA